MKLKHLRDRIQGMSIIELMVAMAVSLIGTIVIFQVYAVNEDVRRSSTAGSDEQTSGLQALILLERELRHAGFGISDSDLYGCRMVTYDNQRVPNFPPAYPLAAVSITANAGNAPDVVNVMYGGTNNTAVAVKLAGPMANATDFPVVNYAYGYLAGDMILLGEDVGSSCTIREITKVNGQELQTNTGSYTTDPLLDLGVAVNKAVRWNNPAGTPVVYGAGKAINLGNLDDTTRPPRYQPDHGADRDGRSVAEQQARDPKPVGPAAHLHPHRREHRAAQSRVWDGRRQEQRHDHYVPVHER